MAELPTWQPPAVEEEVETVENPEQPKKEARYWGDDDPNARYKRMAAVIGVRREDRRLSGKFEVPQSTLAWLAATFAVAVAQLAILAWWPQKTIEFRALIINYQGEGPDPMTLKSYTTIANWFGLCIVWGFEIVLPIRMLLYPYLNTLNRLSFSAYIHGGAFISALMAGLWFGLGFLKKGEGLEGFLQSMGNKGPIMNGWFLEVMLGALAGGVFRLVAGLREKFEDELPERKKLLYNSEGVFKPEQRK